jgi:hypothetical protein
MDTAKHVQTERQIDAQAKQTAINQEIPLGQLVHALWMMWEKLPRRSRPRLHAWLDEVMPQVNKRKRQRHVRAFLIVSSEDWPVILRTTEVEIAGMDSILRAARIYSGQTSPPRKKRTPMTERYLALRETVIRGDLDEARELVAKYDSEDVGRGDDNDQE